MADVRNLLRNELASRKGSSQTGDSPNRVTKKRKVDNTSDSTRKRLRSADTQADEQVAEVHNVQPPSAEPTSEEEEEDTEQPTEDIPQPETESVQPDIPSQEIPSRAGHAPAASAQTVDEDEWAAFERDVAAPTRVPHAPAALAAEATISAAPISADQLAAQQRENESAPTRETEVEGEREDAARFMEDEFEEMEQLEERVRRLKQKREELRQNKGAEEQHQPDEPTQDEQPASEASDDDEDDDWDNWRFR